jgi:D-glycero-alpha-D-manno-heptose-7-phosphate kinase
VRARAPVRVCDLGGWTDTWFAGHGRVMSLAVNPGVAVEVVARPAAGRERITIDARDYGDNYTLETGDPLTERHPLLEAAAAELGVAAGLDIAISIHSEVPPGSSTGTSASVCVAILGAMDALLGTGLGKDEIARAAHRVEVDRLGLQSGIQDQVCAVHGGALFIEMSRFPDATALPLELPGNVQQALDSSLVLMVPRHGHVSSSIHGMVIAMLEEEGAASPMLEDLRQCAEEGRDALVAGDLRRYAAVLVANTEAQRRLHPGLVSPDLEGMIATAAAHGALGWKVNGAGGEGGSLTVMLAEGADRNRVASALGSAHPTHTPIFPTICGAGLEVSPTPF